jgi:hypothetical protein
MSGMTKHRYQLGATPGNKTTGTGGTALLSLVNALAQIRLAHTSRVCNWKNGSTETGRGQAKPSLRAKNASIGRQQNIQQVCCKCNSMQCQTDRRGYRHCVKRDGNDIPCRRISCIDEWKRRRSVCLVVLQVGL